MKRGSQGRYVHQTTGSETVRAYVPNPLPPEPAVLLEGVTAIAMERAQVALGRLDGLSVHLPDPSLFLYYYARKEAVLSSQIEGTQSSLNDLLMYESEEAPGVPIDDVQEVSNYVAALSYGTEKIKAGNPLTLRLIKEIHERLLSHGRGSYKQPGEFRRSQNWIGGSRPGNALFVPPPPDEMQACLFAWENFMHGIPEPVPSILRAGLLHVQFETIHPFLDGNGRVGRLLIPLQLCHDNVLQEPLLYISLYFKQHRQAYYQHLQAVRMEGDWELWLNFFFTGVELAAEEAVSKAKAILNLTDTHRAVLLQSGRAAATLLRLREWMERKPIFSIQDASVAMSLSVQGTTNAATKLQELGLIRELSGKKRGRIYTYGPLLDLLQD